MQELFHSRPSFLLPSIPFSYLLHISKYFPPPLYSTFLFSPPPYIHNTFSSFPRYFPLFPPLLSSSPPLQVRDLSSEAMRLSALYPGGNAKGIMAKQELINTAWESLTLAIQGRKKMLRSSLEFQKFLSSVRKKLIKY